MVFNGVEFTEIEYIFQDDTEIQQGILIHDLRDENRDGDMIIGNGAEMPTTEEEAKMLLENETGSTQFHEVNGIYFIEKEEKPWYAVLRENDDNDWGTGSYDFDEALTMAREWRNDGWPEAYIAVIDESGPEPFCLDEIHDIDG